MIFNLAVLEDNDYHYLFLEQILKDQPKNLNVEYKIERYKDVDSTLKGLFGRSPDALILDLNVLDSSGIETYEKLKKVSTTILVTSVVEDIDIALKCMKEGHFYMAKDWIFSNPLLLRLMLLHAYELSLQRQRVKILIKERLGKFRQLIPRCKFCVPRIGEPRFKDESDNQWYTFTNYAENLGIYFTDGICPECFEDIRKSMGEENGNTESS